MPTRIVDKNGKELLLNTDGSLTISAGGTAPSNVSSTAYEASHVVKNAPGTLFGISGYNSLAGTQFIQLHDATSVPANTAVPVAVFAIPASSSFTLEYGPAGRAFATGIVICNSSTGPTKTLGAADCWFDCQYI